MPGIKQKQNNKEGYTAVANRLLEALAMARLSGVQKSICLFILRRTFGWQREQDCITLKEFASATGSSVTYISKQLKQLVEWNIVQRTTYQPGKAPFYTLNTRVNEWDKGCINVQGLNERVREGLYKCSSQGLHKSARGDTNAGREYQAPVPSLKKELKKEVIHDAADIYTCKPKFVKTYHQEFGRLLSPMEFEKLNSYQKDGMDEEVICEAIKRARAQGQVKLAYVMGILNSWLADGITTMSGVSRADLEFQKRKNKRASPLKEVKKHGAVRANYQAGAGGGKYGNLIPIVREGSR